MASVYDQMSALTGMNYKQLMELSAASMDEDFAQLLPDVLKSMPLTSVQFTASDYLGLLNTICGDSHFSKSGANYVNTFLNEGGLTGTFTITTSGGAVNGYAIEMKADPAVLGAEMNLKASMEGKQMEMTMNVAATAASSGVQGGETISQAQIELNLTMDGTYQSTSQSPATQPPAGAAVTDLTAMFDAAAMPATAA